jgi:hypothetical protein
MSAMVPHPAVAVERNAPEPGHRGRGRLARAWDAARSTSRAATDGACADLLYSPAEEASNRAITDAVASLDLGLTDDEVAALEAPYTPRYDWQGISDEAEMEAIRRRVPGMPLS